ncbi:hypothetical protein P3T36_003387 [Kitasatospora sp. MAP12-15]|uniref:hypothetical protein n=1 Tax=unclassified Kitasatospora TaxID=2633591 RepID=UPI002475DFA8|nr:hypothetical protein [Kitasatospora sp. MAP12-44]MDH6111364.1 hypothetical protein [Kitasatospora sp. MAP12-44]
MPYRSSRRLLLLPAVVVTCSAFALCAAAAITGALRQDFGLVSLTMAGCSGAVAVLCALSRLSDRLVDRTLLGALREHPGPTEEHLTRKFDARPSLVRLSLRRLELSGRVTAETDAQGAVRYRAS